MGAGDSSDEGNSDDDDSDDSDDEEEEEDGGEFADGVGMSEAEERLVASFMNAGESFFIGYFFFLPYDSRVSERMPLVIGKISLGLALPNMGRSPWAPSPLSIYRVVLGRSLASARYSSDTHLYDTHTSFCTTQQLEIRGGYPRWYFFRFRQQAVTVDYCSAVPRFPPKKAVMGDDRCLRISAHDVDGR